MLFVALHPLVPICPPWRQTAACVAKPSTFPVIPRRMKCTESVLWLTLRPASHYPHNTSSHPTQAADQSPIDSMAAQLAPSMPAVAALRQDGAPTLRRKQSSPMMPPFMVSAPGKVIVYGEHAVVHGKVELHSPPSSRRSILTFSRLPLLRPFPCAPISTSHSSPSRTEP